MKFTPEHIAELNLLLQFDISSAATGIKVHSNAPSETVSAIERLYQKGLCTLPDGGGTCPRAQNRQQQQQ